ncbi:hypothetical protein EVJ58_g6899 [Rhodofomes roseus]|uniref:Uncharacterized protein n=1 Tax=Rhodofomes roseus TaxID=34475 RepID=A0A4Y9Y5I7_9APHY|nr:hypothetical protein EVJ58_g6899 [Rhodofomes roseus]
MKVSRNFFRTSREHTLPLSNHTDHADHPSGPGRKTRHVFKTAARQKPVALFTGSSGTADDGLEVHSKGRRRIPIPAVVFSLVHKAQIVRVDPVIDGKGEQPTLESPLSTTAIRPRFEKEHEPSAPLSDASLSSASPATCASTVRHKTDSSGHTAVAARSAPSQKVKSGITRTCRPRPAIAPRQSVPPANIPDDCWLGWDVCQAIVKGEYIRRPIESLDDLMCVQDYRFSRVVASLDDSLSIVPESLLWVNRAAEPLRATMLHTVKEQDDVARGVDTNNISGLGEPDVQIIVDAPTNEDLKVQKSPRKPEQVNITCDHTLVTHGNASQSSASPVHSSIEKTATHSQTIIGPSDDVVGDLWNLVDAEMAAVRDRMHALEGLIQQLNKHGARAPNSAQGNAVKLRDTQTGKQHLASHMEIEQGWKQYMAGVAATVDAELLGTSKRGASSASGFVTKSKTSWASALFNGQNSSSFQILGSGYEGSVNASKSEDASFSTIPLDGSSISTNGDDYRRARKATPACDIPSSPVSEAWWCNNSGSSASGDLPSSTSSSVSTPGSFFSDCSSCWPSEASSGDWPRGVKRVREEPRRHWLSPFYKREQPRRHWLSPLYKRGKQRGTACREAKPAWTVA